MNGQAVGGADEGEDPQYLFVRRGEHQVAPGALGALAAARQRCQASAVDELKARQVHDDPRLAACDGLEGSRYVCGVYNVKLPVQRDDDMAAAFSGARVHAEHQSAFLHRSRAGVPAQRLISPVLSASLECRPRYSPRVPSVLLFNRDPRRPLSRSTAPARHTGRLPRR
jgi:hypothetical protein